MSIPPAVVDVRVVEQAAKATLEKWLWTYIGFAEQWFGYPVRVLPPVNGPLITAGVDLEGPVGQRLPLVMLHGATPAEPRDHGDAYDMAWTLTVAVVAGSPAGEEETLRLTRTYGAAIQACLSMQPWEGVPEGVEIERRWMGTTDRLPAEINRRTMAGNDVHFLTIVSNVMRVDEAALIPEPLPDPPDGGYPDYPDAPTMEQFNVTVDRLEP